MILYIDTSALVKRYVVEAGSADVNTWISQARPTSTGLITRAEMGAAISRAARMGWITQPQSQVALSLFRAEWEILGRLPILDATVRRADGLACQHGLRGYDAVHLACALLYQDGLGESVALATYDRLLWQAAALEGMKVLPTNLP